LPGGESTQLRGVQSDIKIPSLFDGLDLGEEKLRYAMPAQTVSAFLSSAANTDSPGDHWDPVQSALITKLAEKSRTRVAGNPTFAKIQEQVQDQTKNRGVVQLGDLRKRVAKEKTMNANSLDSSSKPDKLDQPATLPTAQSQDRDNFDSLQEAVVKEGVNILADAIGAN
jgi:carboxyl-terminal processing protease